MCYTGTHSEGTPIKSLVRAGSGIREINFYWYFSFNLFWGGFLLWLWLLCKQSKIGSGSLFSTSGITGNWSVLLMNPMAAYRAFPPQTAGGFVYSVVIPIIPGMHRRAIRQAVSWLLGPSDSPNFVPQCLSIMCVISCSCCSVDWFHIKDVLSGLASLQNAC